MARKHIPLTISRPGVEALQEINFTANVTGDEWKIPFRYPFVDIANLTALRSAGYFRHALDTDLDPDAINVSSKLGGSPVANAKTNLGFELPHTEKLILLVKVNADLATSDLTITITGSTKYGKQDVTYTVASTATAGQVFEIDLYNFGLYIEGGEVNVSAADATTPANDAKVEFALVARMG